MEGQQYQSEIFATLQVQQPWYDDIARGNKTVEGRVGPYSKFQEYENKVVRICCGMLELKALVVSVRHYHDLASYIAAEGWSAIAPHTGSEISAYQAYISVKRRDNAAMVFFGARIEAEGGMCALQLKLL